MTTQLDLRRIIRVHRRIEGIYADERFNAGKRGGEVRAFALAWAWAYGEGYRGDEARDRVSILAGLGDPADEHTWHRWRWVLEADVPRYEPPDEDIRDGLRACQGTMVRRAGVCGQRTASLSFRVTDPATGQWRVVSYCRRHADEGREAQQREWALQKAGNLPEPYPNTGGLLPCHVPGHWGILYSWASYRWEPPSIGICADDWPERIAAATTPPVRLAALTGGGANDEPRDLTPPPTLRLVRDEDDE